MTNTTSLHNLIYRIAQGDKRACTEFDELTRTKLTQYITGRLGSALMAGDVEEIVSQAILIMFLEAVKYRGKHGDASAWGWAYQIAWNQALKWIKVRKREVFFSQAIDSDVEEEQLYKTALRYNPNNEPVSIEEEVIDLEFRAKAMEILQKLSPREQLILRLFFEKELTLKEIAKFIKVTPARVTQIMQDIRRTCLIEIAKTN